MEKLAVQNTAFLIISLVIFYYLADINIIRNTINNIGGYGYLGSFIAGISIGLMLTVEILKHYDNHE